MPKLKCFYCSTVIKTYGISVACSNCPHSPTYNEYSPTRVWFNDVKKDGSYRAEYDIKDNMSKFFIRKEVSTEGPVLQGGAGGTGGPVTINPGAVNPNLSGPVHITPPSIPSNISFNAQFNSGGTVTITAGKAQNGPTGGNINITGGSSITWELLTELHFPITPINIEEVLDRCLKMKAFL